MNIYVGNLAYSMTEADLTEEFSKFGEVTSVKIITDRYTGNSKGFAFVEMEDEESGEAAISNLNDAEVAGRRIKVNKARPRPNNYDNNRRSNRW